LKTRLQKVELSCLIVLSTRTNQYLQVVVIECNHKAALVVSRIAAALHE